MPKFLSNNDASGPMKGTNVSVSDVLDSLSEGADDDNQDEGRQDSEDNGGRRGDNRSSEEAGKRPNREGKDREGKEGEKEETPIEELDEEDLELSGEEEEPQEEAIEVDIPPKLKDIKKKYPKLLEEFPYIEKMMFRDRQYNQLFGSYDDAVEAHEKAGILDSFEKDLMGGDSKSLLTQIKDNDPKAFKKVANNLLPALFEVDPAAHNEIVSNVAKRLIMRLVHVGTSQKNEQLQDAATLLSQVIFGDTNFTPPTDGDTRRSDDNRDGELDNERESFNQERLAAATQDVTTRVFNTLKNTITQYIDQGNEMSAFVKRHAVDEALRMVDTAIDADTTFRKQMDRLWDAAIKAKFTRSSIDKIRTTYIGRAKGELKKAILKARADALKDNVRRENGNEDNTSRQPSRRGPVTTGRSAPSDRGGNRRATSLERKQGESVLDFLSRD